MNTARKILLKLIEQIPDSQIPEIIDFIGYLKMKKENEIFKDLESTSESSLDFWDNETDGEVWNNV